MYIMRKYKCLWKHISIREVKEVNNEEGDIWIPLQNLKTQVYFLHDLSRFSKEEMSHELPQGLLRDIQKQ